MISNIYKIKCITNLHVGSGEINFNIVDNEVERDPVTNFPTINSSGLKGALRAQYDGDKLDSIFGKAENNPGSMKFLSANILFQAVRSGDNNQVYYLVTCRQILLQYAQLINSLRNDSISIELEEGKAYTCERNGATVDRFSYNKTEEIGDTVTLILDKFGLDDKDKAKVIIVPDNDFKNIVLPVLARNKLDDKGISQNLWYEEVVPHESIFYFAVLNNSSEDMDKFNAWIGKDKLIQIGGNASIGYGLTQINNVSADKK